MQGSASPTIAVVLKGYPRLSETFIAQELLGLEKAGLKLRLFSLRHPSDKKTHPVHQQIKAGVTYLPEYLWREPRRVLAAWWRQRRQPHYRALLRCFWKDLRRDLTANRLRRLGQALVLAQELPSDVAWIYAHFLHTPASVARYAAILRDLPWSCSAHAKDIWTTPTWEKREKLAALSWAVTCTKAGQEHLAALCDKPEKVSLLHHGLDLSRFGPPPLTPTRTEPRLLCVARLVEKKGVDVLLQALARLPRELPWRLTQIGGGPLAAPLAAKARELGIADRIEWRGAASQSEVLAAYRAADIFVLASRIAGDGDRDGLPNVLMEAQSQGLAVVTSDLPGIAELILPEKTGLLVPPNDVEKLSAALLRLLGDSALRKQLGEAGQARVRSHFDSGPGLSWLAARFGRQLGAKDVAA